MRWLPAASGARLRRRAPRRTGRWRERGLKLDDAIEHEFPWVSARHACSPVEVYKLLQNGCERDVAARNYLRGPAPADPVVFKIKPNGDSFFVLREGHQIKASIEF